MSEWISVKDRLPKKESNFLGTDGEVIFAAYWVGDSEKYQVGGWESCCYCGGCSEVSFSKATYTTKTITHWMPLPDKPKDCERENER